MRSKTVAGALDLDDHGEVAFACAGWAEGVDDLSMINEVELGERRDAVAIERRLEGEVEASQGFWRGQPGGAHGNADPLGFPHGELFGQECIDRFDTESEKAPERSSPTLANRELVGQGLPAANSAPAIMYRRRIPFEPLASTQLESRGVVGPTIGFVQIWAEA